jgi:sirohydrochlorin ferrochelatase
VSVALIAVAHGTASAAGSATTARLIEAVQAVRPDVPVELCFLDVAAPRLPDALAARGDAPAVVVPVLLSTGYHVQSDIPAAVAPYPQVRVARHLGPDPLLVDALVDRLGPTDIDGSVVLVGAGSSRPEAADELAATGRLLGERLGCAVTVHTMADDLAAAFAAAGRPVHVATYLLAEGQFVTTLRAAVDGLGTVAPPLGVHAALVELVWARYDAALGATTPGRRQVVR